MLLSNNIHISYSLMDEARAKEVVDAIYAKLNIESPFTQLSTVDDIDDYFDSSIVPSIEAAVRILFLYTRESANDELLKKQFTYASNLNKAIIPVVIETSTLNQGILKVKNPFPFRTSPLFFSDEADRRKLVEQIHAALGLAKKGDIYGSSITIQSDRPATVRRGDEIIGKASKNKDFNFTLAKGNHYISISSANNEEKDWAQFFVQVTDNDTSIDRCIYLEDIEIVRNSKIQDLMYDPTDSKSLNWDLRDDTSCFWLAKTSQDIKKKDVAIASFYKKYIENLTTEPKLKYTEIKLLPEKYITALVGLLTICIWGKALLWVLAFILYLGTFSWINLAGAAWDWLWFDTSFQPIWWSILIWIIYKIICKIVVYIINKKDEIRNNAEINRVTKLNEKLYSKLNDMQMSFLSSRGWKVVPLKKFPGAYPKSALSFDYSSLPDNSAFYDDDSTMELSFSGEATSSQKSPSRKNNNEGKSSTAWIVIGLLAIFAAIYGIVKCCSEDKAPVCTETVLDNGDISYTLADGTSFKMKKIAGGKFKMGNSSRQAWGYEKPVHNVTVSDFYLAEFEVTQQLWVSVMGTNPSSNQESLSHPVEMVSWNDCQLFIQKLNEITGKSFRLPTEAEWEFAARGGNKSLGYKYSGSSALERVGWYKDNSDKKTHSVGQLCPNELGLYDMTGNVWEWVEDFHDYYPTEDQYDPKGPISGDKKVNRGGSCENGVELSRVSIRAGGQPYNYHKTIGLRIAR